MSAERLYTPQMLAAAVELANFPPIENAPLHAEVRSPTCGSTLSLDLVLEPPGTVGRVGMLVRACAVGQAAAAVFARHAVGLSADEIRQAHDSLAGWLDEQGPAPHWPDISLIVPARDFRGRHGVMLLPWKAAMAALSSTASDR